MPIVVPPAGTSVLGAWTPENEEQQLPRAWLVDPIDPQSREVASVFGQGGTTAGDVVDQMVVFALLALRGSGASVRSDGQRFGDVRKLDDQAVVRLQGEARVALKSLIDRRLILLVDVTVAPGADWFEVTLKYVNLKRADRRVVQKPVRYAIGKRFTRFKRSA